jgi:hypothetical protein
VTTKQLAERIAAEHDAECVTGYSFPNSTADIRLPTGSVNWRNSCLLRYAFTNLMAKHAKRLQHELVKA